LKDEKTVQQMETARSCRNLAHRENQQQAQYINGQVFQYIRQFFYFLDTDYKC